MRAVLILAALSLASSVASAQTLTKAEAGRGAVGQCYSACFGRIDTLSQNVVAELTSATIWLASDDFAFTPGDVYESLATLLIESRWCPAITSLYASMVACQAGCLDVERAYDWRTSSARNRYVSAIRAARAALQDAGMWGDGEPLASDDPAFKAACATLAQTERVGESSLPAIPLPMRSR